MADNAKLILPGEFDPAKRYLVKGSVLLAWQKSLTADRVIAGEGIQESQSPQGRIFTSTAKPGAGGEAPGAFCKVYQDQGSWMLLGGTVSAGTGTETIIAVTIGTVGSEPDSGTFYWLEANVTAIEDEGVLMPGCDLGSVSTGSGTTFPDNDIPTVASTSGTIHIPLGAWMGGVFTPFGCGVIFIGHCPGSLIFQRV